MTCIKITQEFEAELGNEWSLIKEQSSESKLVALNCPAALTIVIAGPAPSCLVERTDHTVSPTSTLASVHYEDGSQNILCATH